MINPTIDINRYTALGGLPSMPNTAMPAGNFNDSGPSLMDRFFGAPGTPDTGIGVPLLQAGSSLLNSFMGMKNYGLAKDMLSDSRKQFDMNWGAQKGIVNSQLEDRQRARVASNPGAYQSVGEYMGQYGVR